MTGKPVEVIGTSLDAAREQLEAQYGKGNVYYLRNEEDARFLSIGRRSSSEQPSPTLGNKMATTDYRLSPVDYFLDDFSGPTER